MPSKERTAKWFRLSPLWPLESPIQFQTVQNSSPQHSLTSVSGTRVVDKQLDKQSCQKAFFFFFNKVTGGYRWITEKYFSVSFFSPANVFITIQMWNSGNVLKNLKRLRYSPKSTVVFQVVFIIRETWTHSRIQRGIIVYPGRMLLLQTTLPRHSSSQLVYINFEKIVALLRVKPLA